MPAPNISFAKIVATPTKAAWSQAYNAGSLFLAVSLTTQDESELNLTEEGKKLLNNLEAEFFGLEEKNLETINASLKNILSTLPESLIPSLSLGFIKEDILYCFVQGEGVIFLKRDTIRAPLLKGNGSSGLTSASGHLKTDDLLLIETSQFATLVPETTLKEAFEYPLPNDIAETITPHVHNSQEGGASAIILAFKGIPQPFIAEEQTESQDPSKKDQQMQPRKEPIQPHVNHPSPHPHQEPTHAVMEEGAMQAPFLSRLHSRIGGIIPSIPIAPRQKIIAVVALLLVLLLVGGIVMTKQDQQSQKQDELFMTIYPKAEAAYEEGENLFSLNEPLAREDFLKARDLLKELEGKFPSDSEEAKKIAALSQKITDRIGSEDGGKNLQANEADENDTPLLTTLKETSSALSGAISEGEVYVITSKAIITSNGETVVDNDNLWSSPVSLGMFGTNFYVLDTKEGLVKLIPTEEGYTSSSYFTGESPSLSQGVSLAIDGSIYILMKDGTIDKYTRGEKDPFSIDPSELSLQNPSQLVTSSEMDSLYVLDSGLGKVIKIGKEGEIEQTYQSDVLKKAKAISVSDNEASLYVLQNKNLYRLSLK